MDQTARISKKLKELGFNPEHLDDTTMEWLIKIDDAIAQIENNREDALQSLKNNKVNPTSIRKIIGCSRTTLYESPLKEYIADAKEHSSKSSPAEEISKLKAQKNELSEMVTLMEARDVESEALKREIEILQRKLKEAESNIGNLQKRVNVLSGEKRDLEMELRRRAN